MLELYLLVVVGLLGGGVQDGSDGLTVDYGNGEVGGRAGGGGGRVGGHRDSGISGGDVPLGAEGVVQAGVGIDSGGVHGGGGAHGRAGSGEEAGS